MKCVGENVKKASVTKFGKTSKSKDKEQALGGS